MNWNHPSPSSLELASFPLARRLARLVPLLAAMAAAACSGGDGGTSGGGAGGGGDGGGGASSASNSASSSSGSNLPAVDPYRNCTEDAQCGEGSQCSSPQQGVNKQCRAACDQTTPCPDSGMAMTYSYCAADGHCSIACSKVQTPGVGNCTAPFQCFMTPGKIEGVCGTP